jgi:hypothetical protein
MAVGCAIVFADLAISLKKGERLFLRLHVKLPWVLRVATVNRGLGGCDSKLCFVDAFVYGALTQLSTLKANDLFFATTLSTTRRSFCEC